MTTVQIDLTNLALGNRGAPGDLRLIVSGHAGYAAKGSDIVCAAESILVQSLCCTLAKLEPETLQDFTVDGVAGSGCVGITAIPTAAGWERVRGMFESTCMGFGLLAAAYPENVCLRLLPPCTAAPAETEKEEC